MLSTTFAVQSNSAPDLNYRLSGDDQIHVLASAQATGEKDDKALAFLVPHKRARILQVVVGPDVRAMLQYPQVVQLVRYGSVWAAGE